MISIDDIAFAVKSLIIDPESVYTTSHPMKCSGIDQMVHFELELTIARMSLNISLL